MKAEAETIHPGAISISFGGETLHLLPERAIFWPARQCLIVADVHLGKGTAFRAAGLPVPSGSSVKDLGRISALLTATNAHELVILGDLIHERRSHQAELSESISKWRHTHGEVSILLVRGNHDRRAGRLPAEWGIPEVEEPCDSAGSLVFSHDPRVISGKSVLAGHVHPTFALRDFDRSTVAAPCFAIDGEECLTLPAFGSFTGGFPIERAEGRRVFVTSGRAVLSVK